jgi:ATP-dependent Clp protease, protease subunit
MLSLRNIYAPVMRAGRKSSATSVQYTAELLSDGIDVKNRIVYLHSEIELETVSFVKCSVEMIYQMSNDSKTPVTININSQGGCAFSMFGIVDAIASMESPINTYCNGTAMSAAATILASGTGKRIITRNSFVMVHRTKSESDLMELSPKEKASHRKVAELMDGKLFEVLAQKTHRNAKFWLTNTKSDFFLTPEKAKEYGIVDSII